MIFFGPYPGKVFLFVWGALYKPGKCFFLGLTLEMIFEEAMYLAGKVVFWKSFLILVFFWGGS